MEKITGKVSQIIQGENRGTVMIVATGKDKKETARVAISFIDPKEAARFEHGKEYTVTIAPGK